MKDRPTLVRRRQAERENASPEADAVYQSLQEPYDRLEQIASTVERAAAWQAAGAWPRVTLADVGVLAKLRADVRAQLQQIESRLAEIDDSVFGLIALRDEQGRPSS